MSPHDSTWRRKQQLWEQYRQRVPQQTGRTQLLWLLDVERVLRWIQPWLRRSSSIVDVGTGNLSFAERLPVHCRYLAVDPYPTAGQGVGVAGRHVVEALAEALPLPDRSVQIVLLRESLDHIQDDAGALREAARVLVADGRVLVTLANRRSVMTRVRALRDRVRGQRGYHHLDQHLRHYDVDDVNALAQVAGLRVLRVQSIGYFLPVPQRLDRLARPLARAQDGVLRRLLPQRGDIIMVELGRD